MKRRELLKSIGILSITGVTAFMFSSCAQTETPNAVADADTTKVLSEKEKLIVNRMKMAFKDPEHPTDFELKHTPAISLHDIDPNGFTRVDVTLGMNGIIHPTEPNHWIDYIKFYTDEKLVAEVDFEPGIGRGFSSFYVKLDNVKQLRVESGCNLHGIWGNTLDVETKMA
jgi:superoxide reductase